MTALPDLDRPYYECPEHGPLVNVEDTVTTFGRAQIIPWAIRCSDCGQSLVLRQPPREQFPLETQWAAPLRLHELQAVAKAAEILRAQFPELPFRVAVTDAWVCLKVTGRRSHVDFGMWRTTGEWFEADDHGAMSEVPTDWSPDAFVQHSVTRPECKCPPDYTDPTCPNCTPASTRGG